MRKTIKERRLARGWTQQRLADEVHCTARRISRIEGKGGERHELQAIAKALECEVYDLLTEPVLPNGRPRVEGRGLLDQFRVHSRYDPAYGHPAQQTLPAARQAYPTLMGLFDRLLPGHPEWSRFLQMAPSGSSLETVGHLLDLRREAVFCRAAPQALGFDLWPVSERESTRIVGHIPVPALATPDWLMILQVTVRTPTRYTMDGLVVVLRPYRAFINLEYDGRGHDPRFDAKRTRDLGLVTLRLSERDVLDDIPLTRRLQALGYCLPGKLSAGPS